MITFIAYSLKRGVRSNIFQKNLLLGVLKLQINHYNIKN
jgi:hypothetical protein